MDRQVGSRYRLVEPLGEGGMGVVWRAYDELLDRTVAIKEVRYSGVGDEQRAELNRRTIREARAAGRLDHPSVVVIHDVVEEDGRPWIVMQLVRSRSLAEAIRADGPLPVPWAAEIGARVLDALRAAHATGVLHRDVKPENVLLADDGRVVLTDFGIATLESEAGLTATGSLVGTPSYMPPERLNGEQARPESDLWSLGATLYAAVEGRPPFRRDSWAMTVAAVLRDPLEPPRRAGALTPVIMGWLQRDPAARMPAGQAAHLLQTAARDGSGPHASPPHGAMPHGTSSPYGRSGPSYPPPPNPGTMPQAPHGAGGWGPGPYGTAPQGPGRKLWAPLAAAVAAVVLLGAGGVWLLTRAADEAGVAARGRTPASSDGPGSRGDSTPDARGDQTRGPDGDDRATTPADGGKASTPAGNDRTTPADDGKKTAGARQVPDGWRTHRVKAGGFSVARPTGWRVVKNPRRDSVTISGPGTPGSMIIEWTVPERDHATPADHWKALEREILSKGEFPGYRRIAIRALEYQGRPAADWEFTRTRDGTRIRVINRGFTTAGGRPYALYWETTADRWARDKRYFETFAATFRPEP
ncbi:serine/threonine-protein kinase [Nonomuraea sp. NPDC049649]|uniref:serine/threonine-protein kinase n=1 Tax=Nonomuraea sp. NPDC049649 TaxID=3155776 RepID=UPI00342BBC44